MKYLKYILGIIAILAIAFILLGFIKPKLSYDCEIMVDKPVAESWAVIQDQEKLSEWLPGFQKIEHISGTPGTVGAVSDVYFDANGEQTVIRETITDIVPNESISMTYTSDFMDMDYTMNMSSNNGITKIYSSTTVVGNGAFSKSMVALIGSGIKGQEETNLVNIKKTIEQNTKDYLPVEESSIESKED
ncbi:MAG: SRPBCC family protein [Bacteroidia bacterium]|nr:SRPBCC family protein [Bacteroidia bacterium]